MNSSHTFNERRKRLEPKDSTCRYCLKEHSENMNDNYYAPVYKEGGRTTLIVYNSVRFNKLEVGISRCKKCMSIHDNSSMNAYLISIAFAVISSIIVYMIYDIYVVFYVVFAFPVAIVLLPIGLTSYFIGAKNILTKKEGAKREPIVVQMLAEGWTLTQPSA